MPHGKTYHSGASEERAAILRKVRDLLRSPADAETKLRELAEWIKGRKDRYRPRPGGL
jgi:hypothetical protein